jgi:hypothetical protein
MVQSLLPPSQASPKAPTLQTNHASDGTVNSACTNKLYAHDGDMNPLQVILTRFELVVVVAGEAYLERKESILSSTLTLGLLSEMRDSHSCVSTAKSSKSSPYPKLASAGGLSDGRLTLIPVVISGEIISLSGKCNSSGSGDRACWSVSSYQC